jgi:hypothetical protein
VADSPERVPSAPEDAVDELPNVRTPYDPGRDREAWRGRLAGGLIALFAVTMIASFVLAGLAGATTEEINGLLDRFLGPLVALTGSAIGFYFGGKTRDI